jgi:hypothetical protein
LLCFNSQGERLPTDADSLYHQWMKSKGTFTVKVPVSAAYIAFASQDVKEVAIAMFHNGKSGGGGWSNNMSCRTVHWSNSQFGECDDWTAESNNDPTQWAYNLVPLAPNSKSMFVGWSQLSKGASSSSDPKHSPVVLDANVVEATVISEQPILEAQLVSDGRAVVAVDTSASSSPPPDRSNPMLAPSFRSSYCSCQSPVNIEGPYSVPPVMLIRGCQSSIKVIKCLLHELLSVYLVFLFSHWVGFLLMLLVFGAEKRWTLANGFSSKTARMKSDLEVAACAAACARGMSRSSFTLKPKSASPSWVGASSGPTETTRALWRAKVRVFLHRVTSFASAAVCARPMSERFWWTTARSSVNPRASLGASWADSRRYSR